MSHNTLHCHVVVAVRAASLWPQCDTAGCQFSYIVPKFIVWTSPPLVPDGAQLLFQTCMCNISTYSLHADRILFNNSSLFTVEFFDVFGMCYNYAPYVSMCFIVQHIFCLYRVQARFASFVYCSILFCSCV